MTKIELNPYLTFPGNAREAMEYYHSIFGGELKINTFGEFHANEVPEEAKNGVMHAALESNDLMFMASDAFPGTEPKSGDNVSLSLSGNDEAKLTAYFNQLAEGGQITMPLEQQVWGDLFGMCTDKYGIQWMVNITSPQK